jgi:predicted aspartyl protease
MGSFSIAMQVGNLEGGDLELVPEALVDTGATDTMLPESLLNHLHIDPRGYTLCSFADGESREIGYGTARIVMEGQDWFCPVMFGPDDVYLVGATTLEIFRLLVDPISKELIHRPMRARPI